MDNPISERPGEQRRRDVPARAPFVRRVVATVAIVLVAALLVTLVVLGSDILLAAFAGVLFAVFLRAFTDLLTRYTGIRGGWALAIVLLSLTALLVSGGFLLAPQVVDQFEQVTEQAPQLIGEAEEFLEQRAWGQWILEQIRDGEMEGGAAQGVVPIMSGLLNTFTILLTIFFVGLFAAANPKLYQDGLVHLAPLRHRPVVREMIGEISYTLRWWLIGRAIAMAMVGIPRPLRSACSASSSRCCWGSSPGC